MSEAGSMPFTSAGSPTVDFVALLLLGRERGYLTPDDLMAVLEAVELSPTLIDAVVGRVRAEGIEWRDDGDLSDDPLTTADPPTLGLLPDAAAASDGRDPEGPAPVPDGPPRAPAVDGAEAPTTSEALARLAGSGLLRNRGRASLADMRIDLDSAPGATSDPVRMYLKEIG
jgi:hypothetical protein